MKFASLFSNVVRLEVRRRKTGESILPSSGSCLPTFYTILFLEAESKMH
jgi:hypothetical protein